jgi:hypothetical protein
MTDNDIMQWENDGGAVPPESYSARLSAMNDGIVAYRDILNAANRAVVLGYSDPTII